MIQAVIIDDEPAMQDVNARLLTDYFPEVKIVGIADSVEASVDLIRTVKPDLVLLDIEIKGGSGFHILQKLRPYNFKVVFITGFNDYAIKAIKFSALDYILKPINESEFQQAVQKAVELIGSNINTEQQASVLLESFKKETQSKKLVLKTTDSLHIVDITDILFAKVTIAIQLFLSEIMKRLQSQKVLKNTLTF